MDKPVATANVLCVGVPGLSNARTFIAAAAVALLLQACSAPAPVADGGLPSPGAPGPDRAGAQRLLAEVQHELTTARSSRYQHVTDVDEGRGRYFFDCSGFIDYAVKRAVPADARALPTHTSVRPLAGDIEQYLYEGLHHAIVGWTAVRYVGSLRPGDVVAWLATEDSATGDTGHTMVVLADPSRNPARPGEWLVEVADSTLSPHAKDSRHPGETGLGTGTIGLVADDEGSPVAYYWQGAVSRTARPTEVSLGQPD